MIEKIFKKDLKLKIHSMKMWGKKRSKFSKLFLSKKKKSLVSYFFSKKKKI